jgi:hypothetical protein
MREPNSHDLPEPKARIEMHERAQLKKNQPQLIIQHSTPWKKKRA